MKENHEYILQVVGVLRAEIESLKTLLKEKESSIKSNEFLTVEEVSDFLSLSNSTIYGMVSRREIPHIKVSKRLYFERKVLIQFLKEHRKKTKTEIQHGANQFFGGGAHV